jgi:hypothetical protein
MASGNSIPSFDLKNAHPSEVNNNVCKERVILITSVRWYDPQHIKSNVLQMFNHHGVKIDEKKGETIIVIPTDSHLVKGYAYLVLVDALEAKINLLNKNLMKVKNRLHVKFSAKENKDLFQGIKFFMDNENPVSEVGKGFYNFMVHPTTENLKQIGFEIQLLDSFPRIPRKFDSKTIPVVTTKFSHLHFPSLGAEVSNPTTNSPAGYAAAAAVPPLVVSAAAAVEPPPVVSPPVVSAAAEPLVKSTPAATAAPQHSSVEKTSNPPKKAGAKAVRTNTAVILGSRILSNGGIIPCGGPHFMVEFEKDLVDEQKFIIINKEKIPLGDDGNDSIYTVLVE